MRRLVFAFALAVGLLLAQPAFALTQLPDGTWAEGYWETIDGYRVFILTEPTPDGKHRPPEAFVDTSHYEEVTEQIPVQVETWELASITSPEITAVQDKPGSPYVRIVVRNVNPISIRVKTTYFDPVANVDREKWAWIGGLSQDVIVYDSGIRPPGGVTRVRAVSEIVENGDPGVHPDDRYPQGLKTEYAGDVQITFLAPEIFISEGEWQWISPWQGVWVLNGPVEVRNPNAISGPIRVYYQDKRLDTGEIIASGFLSRFEDGDWLPYQSKKWALGRPTTYSVERSVSARFGGEDGPAQTKTYTYWVYAPRIDTSWGWNNSPKFVVRNPNSFGARIRVYTSIAGLMTSENGDWYERWSSKEYSFDPPTEGTWITIRARLNPEEGPVTEVTQWFPVYGPSVWYMGGSYWYSPSTTYWYIGNRNSWGGTISYCLVHDGEYVTSGQTYFGPNQSNYYIGSVSKKEKEPGWHYVEGAARFNPPDGPRTSTVWSYYVSYYAPYIMVYDYGNYYQFYVQNSNDYAGYINYVAYHDGEYDISGSGWFSGYESRWVGNVYKKTGEKGWHSVNFAARFDPPDGPKRDLTYYYYVPEK